VSDFALAVASFLEGVFACYRDEFPSQSLPRFHASFIGHLLNMVRQTEKFPKALAAVETLFVQVLRWRYPESLTSSL
jgi:hypothetical protein